MIRRQWSSIVVVTALTASGALATTAHAQTRAVTPVSRTAPQPERADVLHQRAARLFESPPRYPEAARLLREAAALRAADDMRAIDELLLAGRLSHYARDWSTARRTFVAAAQRALAAGQLRRAANAYVDAAFNATQYRKWEEALEFVLSAERLAASPYMQVSERDDILARIGPVRVTVTDATGRR